MHSSLIHSINIYWVLTLYEAHCHTLQDVEMNQTQVSL